MSTISNSIPLVVKNVRVSVARYMRFRYLGLLLLAMLLGGAVYVRNSYKGFTTGFYRQMRYASVRENRNLWFLIDYWLEYKNSALTLHFTLPLKASVAAKAMAIEIYDPTIFVDFEFAKDKPIALSGAPPQCQMTYDLPHQPTPAEQARLSQLDNVPLDASSTYGETFANKIFVKCP